MCLCVFDNSRTKLHPQGVCRIRNAPSSRTAAQPRCGAPRNGMEGTFLYISACRKSPRSVIARSAATWQSKEALNKSARAVSERFCSELWFENRRNTLCISRFSNRKVGTKDPLSAAADLFRASLIRKISYSPENIQEAKLFCEIAPARGTPHP